jgi:signal transduction histidine kinase
MPKYLKFWQPQVQTNFHNQIDGMGKQFLSLFLPLTALVGTGLFTFYLIQSNLIRSEIASTERREVEVKARSLANRFSSIRSDLMVLAKQHELQTILDPVSNQETVRKFQAAMAEEYLVVSQEKQRYDQIRFLETTGQEVVRVNFNGGKPSIVPGGRLQNQKERYWFKDSLALQNGEVFVSPLDLNIDFGKIEQPQKPIMRFGTPVFDVQGNKRGIVVLNYLASEFLKDLYPENSQSSGNILLLNALGYWLKGTKPEDEWAFMYDERRDRTFAKAFPEAWQQISKQKNGQFHTHKGLYTFTTIYPLLDVQGARSSLGSTHAFGFSKAQVNAESYSWKLVSHIPTVILTQRSQAIGNQLLLIFFGIIVLIIIASWLLVQTKIKRQQSDQETKRLEQTLEDVHHNQAQLVQTEKMASLGQLVAGVAHEINNPINFIHGNLSYTDEYTQNLLNLIQLYQKYYPNPVAEILAETEAFDLAFVQEDLSKLLASMKMGTARIREIVLSLRNFSRLDEGNYKAVDIHQGLESTLLILQHRLKARPECPAIEIVRDYGNLPLVECYAGQLNQVFMNILANAIDAIEEVNDKQTSQEIQDNPRQITIRTSVMDSKWVEVAIADSGFGIPMNIQEKIFDPFFTTKPVGKGTGMGMSISYKIVTEKHSGKLLCFSKPSEGTEFVIRLPVQLAEKEKLP